MRDDDGERLKIQPDVAIIAWAGAFDIMQFGAQGMATVSTATTGFLAAVANFFPFLGQLLSAALAFLTAIGVAAGWGVNLGLSMGAAVLLSTFLGYNNVPFVERMGTRLFLLLFIFILEGVIPFLGILPMFSIWVTIVLFMEWKKDREYKEQHKPASRPIIIQRDLPSEPITTTATMDGIRS